MKLMKAMAALVVLASLILTGCGDGSKPAGTTGTPVTSGALAAPDYKQIKSEIKIWTVEGEDDGALQLVMAFAEDFEKISGVKVNVENRDVETLREDFQNASLAETPPDMVWTVSDHIGPFTAANLILPVDSFFDISLYADSAVAPTKLPDPTDAAKTVKSWGIPVTNGNQLMLLYHKSMVPEPPKDTDELIAIGKKLTSGKTYGLVYNQNEPFWMMPWLGGFGGKVFDETGVKPTLNTPEMIKTLQFMYDLKYTHKIVPQESDYNNANSMFQKKDDKTGQYLAAMIINGDWALGTYLSKIPDLGIANMPMVKETGKWPAPFISGKYLMLAKSLEKDRNRLSALIELVKFITNKDNQMRMATDLTRLPALKEVLAMEKLVDDPKANEILKLSAAQIAVGTAMPSVPEMRYVWDNARPMQAAVLSKKLTPEEAAKTMQEQTEMAIQRTKKK